jgi:hypothetical protein
MVAPSARAVTIANGTRDCINGSRSNACDCPRLGRKNHNAAADARTRIIPAVASKVLLLDSLADQPPVTLMWRLTLGRL